MKILFYKFLLLGLCQVMIICKYSVYICFYFRYPWGQEAFDKARVENKLIFLSGNQERYQNFDFWRLNPVCFEMLDKILFLSII